MKLTPNAVKVLQRRALRHNGTNPETPQEAFLRVARVVAAAERFYGFHESQVKEIEEQFFQIQRRLEFLSGKPLIQAGRPDKTMSACYVLPIEDSMDGIFGTLRDNIKILKMGGGTGFNFSRLRSRDELVGSSGEPAAGPTYFLKVYSAANKVVRDRGGRRMGAMAILNVDHPDIESFIDLKSNDHGLSNFNLSVGVTDEFMQQVTSGVGEKWCLVDPHTREAVKEVSAEQLFDRIVHKAWETGDPGLFFLDTTEAANPTPSLGSLDGTNPCGEQPLLPYESCNLGSVVLSRFVKEGQLNYSRLGEVVHLAVRFLDDVIDVNNYPLRENEEISKRNRKIGLGVMGFADMLIEMEIPYDSEEAVTIAEEVMSFVTEQAHQASVDLAEERGSFPNFPVSIWSKKGCQCMRNASLTTIAPTGSTSIVADCSPGIEPLFALGYVHKQVMQEGDEMVTVNRRFRQIARQEGFYTEKLLREVAASGTVQDNPAVPSKVKELFKTAHEIDARQHVNIQAAFQQYTDNAVSKTINFPNQASPADVREALIKAWELGCKGITIYRDGCLQEQVYNVGIDGE